MINSLHSFPHLILCHCVSRYIILYYKAELQSLHNLSKSCVLPVEEHNANAGSLTPEPKSLATKSILALLRTDTGWSNSQESSRFWFSPTWWLVHIPMVQRIPRSMQSDGRLRKLQFTHNSHSFEEQLQFVSVFGGGGLVSELCTTLATAWTIAHHAPLSMGFPKQEYQSGFLVPSPGDLPDPGIEPTSPALQADSPLLSHQGSPVSVLFSVNLITSLLFPRCIEVWLTNENCVCLQCTTWCFDICVHCERLQKLS